MYTITYALLKLRSDESSCLSLIQAQTPRQTTLSEKAELSVAIISCEVDGTDVMYHLVEGDLFMLSGWESHGLYCHDWQEWVSVSLPHQQGRLLNPYHHHVQSSHAPINTSHHPAS